MSRYNTKVSTPAQGPLVTEATPTTRTYEGQAGYRRDTKTELFLRATSSFAGQSGHYETAKFRDDKLAALTAELAVDPDGWKWLQGFAPWLRTTGFMRTGSLMVAAEAVHARLAQGLAGGNRQLIDAVLQRADEPGEFLAYWRARFGRGVPMAVQRGVGDAAIRLYNERSLLKWDTESHGIRFGDVLEIVHAGDRRRSRQELQGEWQHRLFKHAVDRRHGNGEAAEINPLPVIAANQWLRVEAHTSPRVLLDPLRLAAAGMTWEDAQSLAGQLGLDKKDVWEAMIPQMRMLALIRNLRNFDQAQVSDKAAAVVTAKLADWDEVRGAGIFPFQFLAAYRHAPSLRWGYPLEQALNSSLGNVPALGGRTLVLVDRSPSMWMQRMSERSDMVWADGAAVFGAALAMRADKADLAEFWAHSKPVTFTRGESVLKVIERFSYQPAPGGTDIPRAVAENLKPHHTRVVIVTDEQTQAGYLPSNMHGYSWGGDRAGRQPTLIDDLIPKDIPLYMWNFGGYSGSAPAGTRNRHLLSGLTDAAFRLIPLIEAARAARWPWEQVS